MTRLIFIIAWSGFFYLAIIHNTNWLFWLCAAIVILDRWIILPIAIRVMAEVLQKQAAKLKAKP